MEHDCYHSNSMQNYSVKIVELNRSADINLLGVQLGRLCICNNVPVNEVAHKLNVSKSIVYKWFVGRGDVGKHLREKVLAFYRSLPSQDAPPSQHADGQPAA